LQPITRQSLLYFYYWLSRTQANDLATS